MKFFNELELKEERQYGKRTAALFMTVLYMATLSPLYLFAEERKASKAFIENISSGISYTPVKGISETEEVKEEPVE
ncbi:MAG: hypothetical protein J6Y36_07250, partial [Treponema sp.]|nr:hypothetical protein [Treponema sp.]